MPMIILVLPLESDDGPDVEEEEEDACNEDVCDVDGCEEDGSSTEGPGVMEINMVLCDSSKRLTFFTRVTLPISTSFLK